MKHWKKCKEASTLMQHNSNIYFSSLKSLSQSTLPTDFYFQLSTPKIPHNFFFFFYKLKTFVRLEFIIIRCWELEKSSEEDIQLCPFFSFLSFLQNVSKKLALRKLIIPSPFYSFRVEIQKISVYIIHSFFVNHFFTAH